MKWLLSLVCLAGFATCQAQQTLGDAARQNRLQKPQAPAKRVITNEDIPSAALTESSATAGVRESSAEKTAGSKQAPRGGDLLGKIRAQKLKIKNLEQRIAADQVKLNKMTGCPAGDNCQKVIPQGTGLGAGGSVCNLPSYANPYQGWCDEPAKVQAGIDETQKQIDKERALLEALQEEARKQGYGNSAYDPD